MKQFIYSMAACALAISLGVSVCAQNIEYCDIGYPVDAPCASCEPGVPVCSQCFDLNCDGGCHHLYRRLGFYGGAAYDIPLEGIFQPEEFISTTAAGLGVAPVVLPGATQVDLLFDEMGFDDIYDGFFGYSANLTIKMDRSTKWYVGYRQLNGRADPIQIGEATIDPLGAATTETITAHFEDYDEWAIQVGFLTSRAVHKQVEFVWGGRGSVAQTEAITGTYTIPNAGRAQGSTH